MHSKSMAMAMALAGTIGFAAVIPASAQGADYGTGTMTRNPASTTAAGQSFDKTGDAWAAGYAARNNGRISRQAYMHEMARRWDAMDRNQQGLTPAQVSHLYGNVDSAAAPGRTGTSVQPGNMGPGNQKGQ